MNYTLIPNKSLTLITSKNDVLVTRVDNPNWDKIMDALKTNDEQRITDLMNIAKVVESFGEDVRPEDAVITVSGDQVLYRGEALHGLDVDRILEFSTIGIPSEGMIRFLENKFRNPSKRSIDELYKFLEHRGMPITPAGTFLGYKGVNSDFYSVSAGKEPLLKGKRNETGQIYNGVGEEISLERRYVDDNFQNECSNGLHVGSLQYAATFGSKVVIVEVDPADVVSVPYADANKLRVHRYKVVAVFTGKLPDTYTEEFHPQNEDVNEDEREICNDCGEYMDECSCDQRTEEEKLEDQEDDINGDGYNDGEPQPVEGDQEEYSCPLCSECECESDKEENMSSYEEGLQKFVDEAPKGEEKSDKESEEALYNEGYQAGVSDGKYDTSSGRAKRDISFLNLDDSYDKGYRDGYRYGYGSECDDYD